jgi:hypothetical protein
MELVKDTTADDLRRMCRSILNDVCDGIEITEKNKDEWVDEYPDYGYEIGDYVYSSEWISRNVYDERYLLNTDNDLIEVQLMVAGGGPSIWVHCSANSVEVHGYWGGDHVKVDAFYEDGLGVWGYYNELVIFERLR